VPTPPSLGFLARRVSQPSRVERGLKYTEPNLDGGTLIASPRTNPDVSIIMAAYNSMPYITRSLESVMEQSIGQERIELIVFDDCSTDGTYEEILRFAEMWPAMMVSRAEKNSGGPSAPRNRGLEQATAEWVFFLDADDFLGPEALERMIAAAEENESEIVLGKMVGVDGRIPPRSMYQESQPRADLFSSRVYWTLTSIKLIKRDLIERLGLRFDEDLHYAEDQPFTALAYLKADGITVVADYDCIHVVLRDDGKNMTNYMPLEPRIVAQSTVLDLVTSELEPGPKRDWLLQRHLQVDIIGSARQIARQAPEDAEYLSEAVKMLQRWSTEIYNEEIGERLYPIYRLTYELLRRERIDLLPALYEWENDGHHHGAWFVDNGCVFEKWPFFRDPEVGLPDYCYDMTDRVRVRRHVNSVSWNGSVLELSGHAFLHRIDSGDVHTEIVVSLRDSDIEYLVETEPCPARDSAETPGSGFSAKVDTGTLADEYPLPAGLWDVNVRLSSGGFIREARLGANRDEDASVEVQLHVIGEGNATTVATPYHTDPYDNLSIDVGQTKFSAALAIDQPRWDETHSAVLVAGSVAVLSVPQGTLVARLSAKDGPAFDIPALLEEGAGETCFSASIPLKSAAGGRPLPDGTWKVTAHLEAGALSLKADVPDEDGLGTIRWWRGLRPMHAKSLPKPGKALRLRIKPVDLVHAVKRRFSA